MVIQFFNLPESQIDIDLSDQNASTKATIIYTVKKTNGTADTYQLNSGKIHITANNKNTIEGNFTGKYESGITVIGFSEGKFQYNIIK